MVAGVRVEAAKWRQGEDAAAAGDDGRRPRHPTTPAAPVLPTARRPSTGACTALAHDTIIFFASHAKAARQASTRGHVPSCDSTPTHLTGLRFHRFVHHSTPRGGSTVGYTDAGVCLPAAIGGGAARGRGRRRPGAPVRSRGRLPAAHALRHAADAHAVGRGRGAPAGGGGRVGPPPLPGGDDDDDDADDAAGERVCVGEYVCAWMGGCFVRA